MKFELNRLFVWIFILIAIFGIMWYLITLYYVMDSSTSTTLFIAIGLWSLVVNVYLFYEYGIKEQNE